MDDSLDGIWWLEIEIFGGEKRDANLTELDKLIEDQEARIAHIRHYSKRTPVPTCYAEEIDRIQAFKGLFRVGDRLMFGERRTPSDVIGGYVIFRYGTWVASLITTYKMCEEWQENL